jgi:hypothetical protein
VLWMDHLVLSTRIRLTPRPVFPLNAPFSPLFSPAVIGASDVELN